jgi:hypothetical protein
VTSRGEYRQLLLGYRFGALQLAHHTNQTGRDPCILVCPHVPGERGASCVSRCATCHINAPHAISVTPFGPFDKAHSLCPAGLCWELPGNIEFLCARPAASLFCRLIRVGRRGGCALEWAKLYMRQQPLALRGGFYATRTGRGCLGRGTRGASIAAAPGDTFLDGAVGRATTSAVRIWRDICTLISVVYESSDAPARPEGTWEAGRTATVRRGGLDVATFPT